MQELLYELFAGRKLQKKVILRTDNKKYYVILIPLKKARQGKRKKFCLDPNTA
jgi:hypothetical protein